MGWNEVKDEERKDHKKKTSGGVGREVQEVKRKVRKEINGKGKGC